MTYPDIRYDGSQGEVSAVHERSDREADLALGGKSETEVHYLATGASTNGDFGLYRWEFGFKPASLDSHFHRTFSESFYILSGKVRLFNGENWIDTKSGDFLYVPPGGIHAFANESGERATMLVLFAPGAPREAYFEALADVNASGRKLSDKEMAELYRRHDQYMV